MRRTYTFNGPLAGLLYLLIGSFTAVLILSWLAEHTISGMILILVNLFLLFAGLLTSYYRRLSLSETEAVFWSLRGRRTIAMSEVKHFGIVKYRSFRFMFLSRAAEKPFTDPDQPVVSSDDTFVIQFRSRPWEHLQRLMGKA